MGDPVPSSAISDATVGGLSLIVITGGSTGQVLTRQSDGTYAPATVSAGSGDVVGPSSATDNAIARFDTTTGKLVQNCGVTVSDTNAISNVLSVGLVNGAETCLLRSEYSGLRVMNAAGSASAELMATNFKIITNSALHNQLGFAVDSTGYFGFTDSAGTAYATPTGKLCRNSSGGWSSLSDAGFFVRNLANSADAPLTAAAITASGLMCAGVYTFATVPSASSNTGKFLRISDRAQKHAYSDGTNWRFFGDDAVIS